MAALAKQRHMHIPYTLNGHLGGQQVGYMSGPIMDDHSSGNSSNHSGLSGGYRGTRVGSQVLMDHLHSGNHSGHASIMSGQRSSSSSFYSGMGPTPLGSAASGSMAHHSASLPPPPPPPSSGSGSQMQNNDIEKPIGYGAFGVVWAVTDPRDGRRIAIKKLPNVFQSVTSCRRVYRELKMLCTFQHDNVLSAVDILKPPESQGFNEIYIATEYMQSDLHRIIVSPQPLSIDHIKVFIYQILRGLKYLHSANILHRDIKPGNLLINANCVLKICDFGLARVGEPDPTTHLTHEVVTQYYRAPELLMGAKHYTAAIDIWSVGCILAELLSRRILFQAQSPVQQLDLIVDLLGTPALEDIKSACDQAKLHVHRNGIKPSKLSMLYSLSKDCDHEVIALLTSIFVFNPERRITAASALALPFVEDGRLRYHTCMCKCCPTQDGRRYTDCLEPICPTPFHFTFEDELINVLIIRDKLNRLYREVQDRQVETLQLNVSSPLYKKFVKSQCAQPSELPPSPHVWA